MFRSGLGKESCSANKIVLKLVLGEVAGSGQLIFENQRSLLACRLIYVLGLRR